MINKVYLVDGHYVDAKKYDDEMRECGVPKKVIPEIINNEETIEGKALQQIHEMGLKDLRKFATEKGIKYSNRATRDQMITKLQNHIEEASL